MRAPDRWTRLEAATEWARKRQEEMAKHGKVRIIVKDGVPQEWVKIETHDSLPTVCNLSKFEDRDG